jgi:hypothetical protein
MIKAILGVNPGVESVREFMVGALPFSDQAVHSGMNGSILE